VLQEGIAATSKQAEAANKNPETKRSSEKPVIKRLQTDALLAKKFPAIPQKLRK
jgi:hypothetical protein